jgi:hypothetical protein
MSVLLGEGWAHAQATIAASAAPIRMGNGLDCGVIGDKARRRDVFDPVMIRERYHHQP